MEFFTEPETDALGRVLEYEGRFMQDLRHGPRGRDQYVFLPGLVFLTGSPPRVSLVVTVPGMSALVFARLTSSVEVWKKGLEGIMLKVSPYMEEVREEGRVQTRRQDTIEALEIHFPGAVPAAVVERTNAETDLERLRKWHRLAVKADLAAIQADMAATEMPPGGN